ncbi:MAG: FISUMP domain-containing protein, partial [Ignavibacteriaceae bacterium]
MKCPSCGKENPDDAQYCTGCWNSLYFKKGKWRQWYKKKSVLLSGLGILLVIAMLWLLLPGRGNDNKPLKPELVTNNKTIKPEIVTNDKSVENGEQVWMAENLNVDHYRNGDIIPEVQDAKQWKNLKTGAWCYFDNDPENGKKYGKLYNWYAVNDPRGLAPKGWHIPTQNEFETLKTAVNNDGNALKALGQGEGAGAGTNTNGFSALFAGVRSSSGTFGYLDSITFFWSSTQYDSDYVHILELFGGLSNIYFDHVRKLAGLSVRCVKERNNNPDKNSSNNQDQNVTQSKNEEIINFAKDTFSELVNGNISVEDKIDWSSFVGNNINVGEFYSALPNETERNGFRKSFISSYSSSFKSSGGDL